MRNLLPALIAGVVALVIGAGGMWFLLSAEQQPSRTADANGVQAPALDNSKPLDAAGGDAVEEPMVDASREQLDDARREIADLKQDREALVESRDALQSENTGLQSEVERLQARVTELEALAAGPNNLRAGYGKWSEVRELRETEWKDVGDAVHKMNPLLGELSRAILEGKDPPPELMQKIGEQNRRVLAQYGKAIGKLPTHSTYNGEFTHPVYFMNMLAAQLEAAGDPLSEQQLADIIAHGEEYDARWAKLQESYDGKSWFLVKLLDEAELKEWFIARMFEVTTQTQEAIARPAESKGYLGLDLYSAGLMLAGNVAPVVRTDVAGVRETLREQLVQNAGLTLEQLDASAYILDDWLNALSPQLQPRPRAQTELRQVQEVLASGRAQVTALKALESAYAFTDEARARFAAVRYIFVPLVVQE